MTKNRDQSPGSKFKKQMSGSQLGKKPRAATGSSDKSDAKKFAFEEDQRPRLKSPQKEKVAQPLNDMRMGELLIERMGHDGRGIAYWTMPDVEDPTDKSLSTEKLNHQGKIVFVKQAITGERVNARLVKEHSRFIEARVESLVISAPERIAAECEYFGQCGGCQLQHVSNQFQLAFKQKALLEQLGDSLKPKKILAPIESPSFAYRRAARLSVSYLNGVSLGFREENSRDVVSVQHCAVLTQSLSQLIKPLNHVLDEFVASQAITHIELIDASPKAAIIFRVTKSLTQPEIETLNRFAETYQLLIFLQVKEGLLLTDLQGESVDPRLTYSLSDFSLALNFHPRDFIQVNATVNEAMVKQAVNLLQLKSTDRVLDLFCGIGNFTLPIASRCAQVIGMEAVESMVQRGRENALNSKIFNAEFIASDLTKLTDNRLKQVCGKIDAVLLDPPREGAKEIVGKLAQLSPSRIVYVSCNPATLARDAKILRSAGYKLDALGVMDMFPQTAHLESMALFVL